jgi:hypothetical protein
MMRRFTFPVPSLLVSWATLFFGLSLAHPLPLASAASGSAADPWADEVIAFDLGVGGAPGFHNPLTVLGEPERFTGEGFFPSVVSPFSGPYMPDELLSLGAGGWIILRFDEPIEDHPENPFGIDFLIFGNAAFIDGAYPEGVVAGLFSDDGGAVEGSADGVEWFPLAGIADGLFPTVGYLDAGPFDALPGEVLSDFTKPVDPALTLEALLGLDHWAVLELYSGSGGGAGFDLAQTGLASISFVRVSVARESRVNVEIDALSDVAPAARGPSNPADLNRDGIVDGADLGLLLSGWGGSGAGDLDGDGVVDGSDLGLLLAAFGGP